MLSSQTSGRLLRWAAVFAVGLCVSGCVGGVDDLNDADIAYVSANPPEPRFVTIQAVELGHRDRPVAEPPRPDQGHITPHFSPDGRHIAYERRVPDQGERVGRLLAVDAEGFHQRELTALGHDQRCQLLPRGWNAEGTYIAFVCNPVGNTNRPRQVGYAELEGGSTRLDPVEGVDEFTDVQFTPHGDLLTLARDSEYPTRSLVEVDPSADDGDPDRIATFEDDRPIDGLRISPDGTEAALVRMDDDTDQVRPSGHLMVVDLESGDTRRLLADDNGQTASGPHSLQGWHPDGDRLLVATGGFEADPGPLRMIDATDDTEQTTLAEVDDLDYGTIRRADISPDGEMVVFSDNDADEDNPLQWRKGRMYLVNTDGSDLRQLDGLTVPDEVTHPTFNPQL